MSWTVQKPGLTRWSGDPSPSSTLVPHHVAQLADCQSGVHQHGAQSVVHFPFDSLRVLRTLFSQALSLGLSPPLSLFAAADILEMF